TLHIELFTQLDYRQSIEAEGSLSELFKDVVLFHWKEESQHAILDELELRRLDADVSPVDRDRYVDEFIDLVVAVDGILQMQSAADAEYFAAHADRVHDAVDRGRVQAGLLKAYRWQFILSGAAHPHFLKVLTNLITETQTSRITSALATL